MMYNRKAIKLQAKQAMVTARPRTWVVTLVLLIVTALIPVFIQMVASGPFATALVAACVNIAVDAGSAEEIEGKLIGLLLGSLGMAMLVSLVIGVLTALLKIVMNYGYCGYAYQVWRGRPAGLGSLFSGFGRLGGVLGSGVLVGVFTWLWSMLVVLILGVAGFAIGFLLSDSEVLVSLLSLVLSVLAVVAALWIEYRYFLTPYYIMTRPNMGAMEAITASKRAMKGNKGRLFVLKELSFLGWELLLGLIVSAVALVGMVIAALIAGGGVIDMAERVARGGSVTANAVLGLIAQVAIPVTVVLVVVALVKLPMQLWLTAYKSVSYAGFFQAVAGEERAAAAFETAPLEPVAAGNVIPEPVAAEPAAAENTAPQAEPLAPAEEKPYSPFGVEELQIPEAPAEAAEAPQAPAETVEEPQAPAEPAQDTPEQE